MTSSNHSDKNRLFHNEESPSINTSLLSRQQGSKLSVAQWQEVLTCSDKTASVTLKYIVQIDHIFYGAEKRVEDVWE
jgi:hypothetical protein